MFDLVISEQQRFLHVKFSEDDTTGVWFLKADSAAEKTPEGKQTESQPLLVIYTDNCKKLYRHVLDNKVNILEDIQEEALISIVLIFMETE